MNRWGDVVWRSLLTTFLDFVVVVLAVGLLILPR